MSKVSVIIPVYNVEKYLRQCLDSVVNQTFKDIEIICVNDGSSDKSLDILNEYAAKDTRIKIISQENKGVSTARNVGIGAAKGEYIHFIDGDDFIDKKLYEELLPDIEDKKLDIFMFGHAEYINDEFRDSFTKYIFNQFSHHKISSEDLIIYFLLGVWNKIYKTSFIKKNSIEFPTNIKIAEDAFFGSICATYKPRFDFTSKCYYYYRFDNLNSCSNNLDILIDEEFKAHDCITKLKVYKGAKKTYN